MSDRPPPSGQSELWQPSAADNLEMSINLAWVVIKTWACCGYVFTRYQFGQGYFAMYPFLVVPLIQFYGACASPGDPGPYHVLTLAWVGMFVLHMVTNGMTAPGKQQHSRYNGMPRVCKWFSLDEQKVKQIIEPLVVAGLGWAAYQFDEEFGLFVFIVAAAMFIDHMMLHEKMDRRMRRMKDAEMEQDFLMEEYERKYGRP